jgi:1-acyl-sn-glycerol-3-phosphate acyltransferase
MKASLFRKVLIIVQSTASTLGISLFALYMRITNTYDRKLSDRILRWWSGYLLKAAKVRYEVSNPHNVTLEAGVPYIVMSNHRSHYDIPLIFVSIHGSIRMLTKKELFKVPIWGRGLKAAEFVSIDRKNHGQAMKDLEIAKAQMQSGIVLWIAPEGTRSRSGALGGFKKGGFMVAIQTGAMIVPVGIQNTEKILPPDTLSFNLNQQVRLTLGEPIDASKYDIEQRERLMEEVRDAIQALANQ